MEENCSLKKKSGYVQTSDMEVSGSTGPRISAGISQW